MPLSLDPNARTTIYLKADLARPPEQRVGFLCRFITMRQRQEHQNKMADACRDENTGEQTLQLLKEALAIGVIGPIAKDVPCTIEGVIDVLTGSELWDLAWEYPHALTAGEWDKKKSESPSPTASTESAKATGAA